MLRLRAPPDWTGGGVLPPHHDPARRNAGIVHVYSGLTFGAAVTCAVRMDQPIPFYNANIWASKGYVVLIPELPLLPGVSSDQPQMLTDAVLAAGPSELTRDIDAVALLPEEQWATALSTAANYGIAARIEDPLGFARRSRMLLLTHQDSKIDIDLSLGGLAFEQEALNRSQIFETAGIRIRLPSVEDLLIMKAFAHRPKDMEDIEGLLEAHPDANLEIARQWISEFANAMTMPDLLEDFEKIVARRKSRR